MQKILFFIFFVLGISNSFGQDCCKELKAEVEILKAKVDSLTKFQPKTTPSNYGKEEKQKIENILSKIEILIDSTGFVNYYNKLMPIVFLKIKNLTDEDLSDDLNVKIIFIDSISGETLSTHVKHVIGVSIIGGKSFINFNLYNYNTTILIDTNVKFLNIKAKIYLGSNYLFKEILIDKKILFYKIL